MFLTGLSRRAVLNVSAGLLAGAVAGPRLARAKTRITIVTGGTGGVFYPYGGGIAKILSEKVPDMQATAQVTGGSVDNVKLLAAGEAELGFATLDSAWEGLNGLGAYANDGKQDIRTVALLYDSFFHVCTAADAQIGKVADFKGKRVSVGSAGSSTESIADRVLKAAGLDPQEDVGRDNLGIAESVGSLKDGKIVGFFWIGGVPTAAVKDPAAYRGSRSWCSFRPAANCRRSTRSSPASIDPSR
jgi:TRAP transporter TAXI family solute receptor